MSRVSACSGGKKKKSPVKTPKLSLLSDLLGSAKAKVKTKIRVISGVAEH